MRRFTRRPAPLPLAATTLLAAALLGACQDYNFSPVNYALIQPGTVRVTLSDLSTADLLFVVDDSGSMGGEQQKLAQSFDAFVKALRDTNIARVGADLEPIDFHVAVTTTSVFLNQATTSVCAASCAGASNVCCDTINTQPLKQPRGCATPGSTAECGAGHTCRNDCLGRAGELTCCNGPTTQPEQANVPCSAVGEACGRILNRYGTTRVPASCVGGLSCPSGTACRTDCPGLEGANACCDAGGVGPVCDIGVGTVGGLYPAGDFVRAGTNPRVLHFDKSLFCPRNATNTACDGQFNPDPAVVRTTIDGNTAPLIAQFKQNVAVGTCGSGQEQPLEAARRAIQKAAAGQQPGVTAGEWLHTKVVDGRTVPSSKLVVIFVGDEDDCSSPQDPLAGVIFSATACENDTTRRFPVQDYSTYLTSLGRPVAGAFIVSAISETCQDGDCNPGLCCDPVCTGSASVCGLGGLCGGQGEGRRLLALSNQLAAQSVDRVSGSICNPGGPGSPGFSSILVRVAEIVKQPSTLRLPTVPALPRLTQLRIVDPAGATRKKCAGPAPAGASVAEQASYDWWFTADEFDRTPSSASQFIFINRNRPNRSCEANPGETYSADYLGKVPSEGCLDAAECASKLSGPIESWRCCVDVDLVTGACLPPPPAQGAVTGTCLVVAGP